MDTYLEFDQRIDRRLGDMLADARSDVEAVAAEFEPKGPAVGGARVRLQLDHIDDAMRGAINYAFGEADGLPGPAATRREATEPILCDLLTRHLKALFDRGWQLAGLPEAARLEGALKDWERVSYP